MWLIWALFVFLCLFVLAWLGVFLGGLILSCKGSGQEDVVTLDDLRADGMLPRCATWRDACAAREEARLSWHRGEIGSQEYRLLDDYIFAAQCRLLDDCKCPAPQAAED